MDTRLKVEYALTKDLAPYAGNAKEHPEWQVSQIAASIDHFGFNDPIGVWTNPQGVLEIVEGHGRVLAAKELGIERVPIVKLDHLDNDARRAYVHVHNQTSLTSGFDLDALAIDLDSIPGFDWEEFGFDDVKADAFGFDFDLPESDAPKYKTVTLFMTEEQHALFTQMQECIDTPEGDGNEAARQVCEVIRQWQAQKI